MMDKKVASELAKLHGLKLVEVSKISGVPRTTLDDWHKKRPKLFLAVVIGCAQIKKAAN